MVYPWIHKKRRQNETGLNKINNTCNCYVYFPYFVGSAPVCFHGKQEGEGGLRKNSENYIRNAR